MSLDAFFSSIASEMDALLGTVTMTCNGQSFNVVWDGDNKAYQGALGGLESEIQATATAQAADVSLPFGLLQKRCVVDGNTFRVASVRRGSVSVEFTLIDPNA
jgi:hypothetical protein|tara:strand:- start:3449 stop:3757 length:309 start_codon:yes stop_codon:yes gene_type:complete